MNLYKALELYNPEEYKLEGLEVGVTSNCNFRCDYCCAYQRNDNQEIRATEVIKLLEELPDLKRVRLSGGEVTLAYDEVLQIVAYCGSRGIDTQLNSNGSLLNPARIDKLVDAGLTTIHISFNCVTPESFHAYYHQSEKVYNRIRDNITYFSQTPVHTVLETLLFNETQHRMKEIHDHVYALGARIHEIQNSIVMPHSGWEAIATEEGLRHSVQELIDYRHPGMSIYFTCMDRFAERLGFQEQEGIYFPNCIEGMRQLHLHGNGDVIISELCHPVKIGNVYEGLSLQQVYQQMPAPLADYLEKRPCPAYDALYGRRD